MAAFLDKIRAAGKAFLGALAAAIAVVLQGTVTAPDGSVTNWKLPETGAEWTAFAVAVALGFLLPWLKRNYPSVPTAEAKLELAKSRVETGKQSV